MSLSLSGLQTCVMSVVAVANLYLAGACDRKSLSGCFMCLNFSHFCFLLFVFLILRLSRYIIKFRSVPSNYEPFYAEALLLLNGCYDHAQYPSVEYGCLIDSTELRAGLTEFLHDLLTDRDVAHLTALEAHDDTYLVTVL